jgi:ferredoxin
MSSTGSCSRFNSKHVFSMARFSHRYPLNIAGRFYIDDQCTDCDLCRQWAPNNIRRDDRLGHSYVFKQPETPEELASCLEGVAFCPTEAVGKDGDSYDWTSTPIVDWNAIARHYGNPSVQFGLASPVIPYRDESPSASETSTTKTTDTRLPPLFWQCLRRLFGFHAR